MGELENRKNHDRHLKSDRSGRRDLLCRTLVGNICPIAERADYVVVSRIQPDVGRTRHEVCTVKSVDLLRMVYEFMANFCDLDCIGGGKSVSMGFGVVVGMKRQRTR